MNLRKIDPPSWADIQQTDHGDLTASELTILGNLRATLLEMIQKCLEEYIVDFDNVDNTAAEDVFENYPNVFEMSGEYYFSDERYEKEDDQIAVNVCLELQQRPDAPSAQEGSNYDYHGVEILVYIDPGEESVSVDGVVSSWGS